jgi:hypothetical protein
MRLLLGWDGFAVCRCGAVRIARAMLKARWASHTATVQQGNTWICCRGVFLERCISGVVVGSASANLVRSNNACAEGQSP